MVSVKIKRIKITKRVRAKFSIFYLSFFLFLAFVGNWFTYSFGENSTGTALGMLPMDIIPRNKNQDKWYETRYYSIYGDNFSFVVYICLIPIGCHIFSVASLHILYLYCDRKRFNLVISVNACANERDTVE